jgi:hypothetical protein
MMQDIIKIVPSQPKIETGRFQNLVQDGFHNSIGQSDRSERVPGQFWEGGVYENEYIFEDGFWKIFKLGYKLFWQADYMKGWSGSEAMKVVEKYWPEDKLGQMGWLLGRMFGLKRGLLGFISRILLLEPELGRDRGCQGMVLLDFMWARYVTLHSG